MDTVPFDFCERVIAVWRCCEDAHDFCRCSGPLPTFQDAKWDANSTVSVALFLFSAGGRWKYGFVHPDYFGDVRNYAESDHPPVNLLLTAGELKNRGDWNCIRVEELRICGRDRDHLSFIKPFLKELDVELENLLKFTSFLADEPKLFTDSLEYLHSAPDGAMVTKWIEEKSYSEISIYEFAALDQSLLEKVVKRRNPTQLIVCSVQNDRAGQILNDYLRSGTLRKLWAWNHLFPFEVFEAIVAKIRANPEDRALRVTMVSDASAEEKLDRMRENGWCRRTNRKTHIFKVGRKKIIVKRIRNGFTIILSGY